jgi:hypothetical protein
LGIGDGGSIGDVGIYDTSQYDTDAVYGSSDPFGYLVDVTERVESLSTRRGRERFTARFRTGTAQVVVLNTDGAFTPPSGGGPIGILPLRPGRAVRITHDSAKVFDGFIDSFDGQQEPSGKVTTKIRCVDQMGQFTRNDLPAVTPEGAGELSFTRMRRLLDRHIDDYVFTEKGDDVNTMEATAMAQDLMSELALTADSEGGGVWVGKAGDVVASGRDFFSDIVNAGIIGWTVGGASPIQVRSYVDEWAAIRIINEAHLSRAGGTEQVRTNDESIAKYGRRTHTRLDLVNDNDEDVATLAERLVQFAGVDRLRITALSFLPTPASATSLMAVSAEFGDLMLVTISTIFGVSWTAPVQIFGVQHTVSDEVWIVSFLTDDTLFTGEFHAFDQTAFDPLAFS